MSATSLYFDYNICLLVIQRSFGAQKIFQTPLDYKFYVKLLKRYKQVYQVKLFAFCLLSSSIYLVMGAKDAKIASDFLDATNESFKSFIAVSDPGRAALHIQRSKALVVDDDKSLFDLITFVESFPVKRGLVIREIEHEWSSFRLRVLGIDNGVIEKLNLCP